MQGRGLRLTLALLAAALVAPAAAEARGNCCFELALDNATAYSVDWQDDGFGYDGTYSYAQSWWVRSIVSARKSSDDPVRTRVARASLHLDEFTGVTRCRDLGGPRPCFDREALPCQGADQFGKSQVSHYGTGYVSVTGDHLYSLPSDDVYYSVDQLGCDGAHGHPGYGERAKGVASDRSVTLKPPKRDFLRAAGRGDRCSYEFFSSLSQGLDHVGSDSAAPHTTATSVRSTYKLSYFPRSDLRKQRKRLEDLPDSTDAFFGWGEDGTGNQRC